MGCCLFAAVIAGMPRFALLLWWFFQPARIAATFDTFLWPLLGVIFAPWTTIAYVFVFPGGLTGLDLLVLAVAALIDLGTYGGNWRARSSYRA